MIYKDHLCETIRRSSLRCSRPLCSSQSTGGTFSACRTATARKGPEVQLPHSRHPVPQDPTACMCRSFTIRGSSPEGRTERGDLRSTPRQMFHPWANRRERMSRSGAWTPEGARCSLERRWSSRTFRYGYLVTT